MKTAKNKTERRQVWFLFSCIGNILYVIPCLMSLSFAMLADGIMPPMILATATTLLGIPAAFVGISCYKKKRRTPVICAAAVMIALHIVSAVFNRIWYFVMLPSLVLFVLMTILSDVIITEEK